MCNLTTPCLRQVQSKLPEEQVHVGECQLESTTLASTAIRFGIRAMLGW